MKEKEDVLDALAKHLIEKENITGKEFMKIYEEITGEALKEAKVEQLSEKQETSDTKKEEFLAEESNN